jgi:hypothetical protein
MADDDGRILGSDKAHTPAEISPDRAAKVGATRALAEAAMAGLADRLGSDEAEPDQPSLLLADPDGEFCLFGGPVRHVADIRDTAKRARGRPKGSQNKRSADLANYLLKMGYRDPALNLADLANANPHDLAAELSEPYRPKSGEHKGQLVEGSVTPGEALELIMKANVELMAYFHAKRPQAIEVNSQMMGVMVIGEMKTERDDGGKVMEMTRFDAPE